MGCEQQAIFKSFKDAVFRARVPPVAASRARGCGWAIQPTRSQTARRGPPGRERAAPDAKWALPVRTAIALRARDQQTRAYLSTLQIHGIIRQVGPVRADQTESSRETPQAVPCM